MTVDEEIKEQESYLLLLKQARSDIASAGLPIRIEHGSSIITYTKIREVTAEIRQVKNSIIILARGIY